MSELRWIILLIGLAIIVGTLVYAQISQRKQERDLFSSRMDADPLLSESDESLNSHADGDHSGAYESTGLDEQTSDYQDDDHRGAAQDTESTEEQEQHIVVLHVIARAAEGFAGQALKDQLEHLGLRHGNFDFYHRSSLQDPDLSLFSVANMFKPGAFDQEDIESYATKGISFFLVLPGPPDAVTTFNEMLQTAKQVASKLEGDVYDADRSTFTGQRAQLIRDEIIGFMHKVSQV